MKKRVVVPLLLAAILAGSYLLLERIVRSYLFLALGENWEVSNISLGVRSISFEGLNFRTAFTEIRIRRAVLPLKNIPYLIGFGIRPKPLYLSGILVHLEQGKDGRWHLDEILRIGEEKKFRMPMILSDGSLTLTSRKGERLISMDGMHGVFSPSGITLYGDIEGSPVSISARGEEITILADLHLNGLSGFLPNWLRLDNGRAKISLTLDSKLSSIKGSSSGFFLCHIDDKPLRIERFSGSYSEGRILASMAGSISQIPFDLKLNGTEKLLGFEGMIGKDVEILGTADLWKPNKIRLKSFETKINGKKVLAGNGYIGKEGIQVFGKDGLYAMVGLGDGGGALSISAHGMKAIGNYRIIGCSAIEANLSWEGIPSFLADYGMEMRDARGEAFLFITSEGYRARIKGKVQNPRLKGVTCEASEFDLDYRGGRDARISGEAVFKDNSKAVFSGKIGVSGDPLELSLSIEEKEIKVGLGWLGEANGKLRFHGLLSGSLDRPKAEGELRSEGLKVGDMALPDLVSSLKWDKEDIELPAISLGGFDGEGRIYLKEGGIEGDIRLSGWDPAISDILKPFIPSIPKVLAEGSVGFIWNDKEGLTAKGEISTSYDLGSISIPFFANKEELRIEGLRLSDKDGGEISANILIPLREGIRELIGDLVLTEFSEISGRISISAEINGTEENPIRGLWKGEGLTVRRNELGNVEGSFLLGRDRIEISWIGGLGSGSFSGRIGKGFRIAFPPKGLDGIGSIRFDLNPMDLPFGLKGKATVGFEIHDGEGKGDLVIKDGMLMGMDFSRLASPFKLKGSSLSLDEISLDGDRWGASGAANVWLDGGLESFEKSRIDGYLEFHGLPISVFSRDLIKEGKARGRVSIGGNISDPVLYGDVEIHEVGNVEALRGRMIAVGDRIYLRELKGGPWGKDGSLDVVFKPLDGEVKGRAEIRGLAISVEGKVGDGILDAEISSKDFGKIAIGIKPEKDRMEFVPILGEPYQVRGFLKPLNDGGMELRILVGGVEARGIISKGLDIFVSGSIPIPSEWSELIRVAEPAMVEGKVYGDLESIGSHGSLILKKGSISGLPFDLMDISWNFSKDKIVLERVRIWKLGSYDAVASGIIYIPGLSPEKGNVSISVERFSGDLHMLKYISERIKYAYGSVDDLRLEVSGPISSLKVTGRLSSKGGEIGFDFLPDPVTSPAIDFEIEDKVLRIKRMEGIYQLQPMVCEGYIGLERGGRIDIRVSGGKGGKPFLLELPGRVREGEYMKVSLLSPIRVDGSLEMPEIHGTALVTDTSFLYPMKKGKEIGSVSWDFECVMGQNVWLENPWIRVNVKGTLRLKGRDMRLIGRLEIVRGTATFLGTDFLITSGSIEYLQDEDEPYVEGRGEARIDGTKVTILVNRARLSEIKPEVMTDNPLLSKAEVMGILVAGKEVPPESVEGELIRVLSGQIGSSLLDPFQREVKRILGLEMFQVRVGIPRSWNFYQIGRPPIGGLEIMMEKYLTEGLYLSYTASRGKPLEGEWRSKIEMDYEITEHIRWRAGVGRDERFILLELRYPF